MNHKNETSKLAYELTYRRFSLNKDTAHNLFTELTVTEYIALHCIARVTSNEHKTYLKDLADHLGMPIYRTSEMVAKLKERGFVFWSHSGNGSDGTYVITTDTGIQAMHRQEDILSDYYSRVIEKFGQDNLVQMLQQMEKLEKIMDSEFTENGGDLHGSETTECVHPTEGAAVSG